jgi:hypothetical protein
MTWAGIVASSLAVGAFVLVDGLPLLNKGLLDGKRYHDLSLNSESPAFHVSM